MSLLCRASFWVLWLIDSIDRLMMRVLAIWRLGLALRFMLERIPPYACMRVACTHSFFDRVLEVYRSGERSHPFLRSPEVHYAFC
jgi:hypothetical protein